MCLDYVNDKNTISMKKFLFKKGLSFHMIIFETEK